jgi:uncharacterized protein (TIGR00369 family)
VNELTEDDPRHRAFAAMPLHRAMGLRLLELRPGFARVAMRTSEFTVGGIGGSVHGGLLAALVDIVMLQAVMTVIRPNERPAGTADLNITYLRPALGEEVSAEATVIRKGRHLAVTEVSILGPKGELCARGRTLYALRPVTEGADRGIGDH